MLERVIFNQKFNAEEVRKIIPKGSGTDRKATLSSMKFSYDLRKHAERKDGGFSFLVERQRHVQHMSSTHACACT